MQDNEGNNQDSGSDAAAGGSVAVKIAARLRAAREERGLTVDDVVHNLHLDRNIVLALESAEFESLGAPVFVRGYLRSYARLLDLPEELIVAGVDYPETEAEEFRTLSTRSEVKPGRNLVNFVVWVLLALIVLAGLIYVFVDNVDESLPAIDTGEFNPPAEEVTEAVVVPPPPPAPPAEVEVVEPVVDEEPVIEADPMPQTVPLTLRFTEECWVEISDAENRLLYGLEKAGDVKTLEGIPPFRIFLGRVSAVELAVEGVPVDIAGRYQVVNNTARFELTRDDLPTEAEVLAQ